ncbi:MAG: NHL repeat-containing protein [Proteobacteria bacterium]|nr:NHL repeat-containing protein [Pseudomonadota bacterium]MBU4413620.1 NHL repeat-containing protein [Pseudomonadota bacterium]
MIKKSLLFFCILLFLIVPLKAYSKEDAINIITTLSGNQDIGMLGLIGGVFFDENKNRLYVTDSSNCRILSYDSEFNYLSALHPKGDLKNPTSILGAIDGRFLVVEPSKRNVVVIDVAQKSINSLDLAEVPDSDTFNPGRMAIDSDGNIYIIDRANNRILVFNSNLKFNKEVIRESKIIFNDIKVGKQGDIYTLSTLEGIARKYDRSGKKILEFGGRGKGRDEFSFPTSLAVDNKGLIYIVDQHKNKIFVFDRQGKFVFNFSRPGWIEGCLATPSYIFINNSDTIFVVDRDNSRVSIFK